MSQIYTRKWVTVVQDQVYLLIGSGDLSAEDLRNFDHEFLGMIEASSAPLIHLIADSRQVSSLPSLGEMRKSRYPYHARMGYNITVGAYRDPVMRFVLSVSTAISQVRYKDVATLAEACAYLAHKNPSLPPVHTWTLLSEVDLASS